MIDVCEGVRVGVVMTDKEKEYYDVFVVERLVPGFGGSCLIKTCFRTVEEAIGFSKMYQDMMQDDKVSYMIHGLKMMRFDCEKNEMIPN